MKSKGNRFETKKVNDSKTIGELDKKDQKGWTDRYTPVGRLSVSLLKEYLKRLDNDNVIGVYIDKGKELVPLHCKGILLAPMSYVFIDEDREFDK
ncbi:MAG: hypothetical protein ACTSX6_04625 [Candidatus Heimdallarchaeaceae archaeon]